MQKLFIVTRGYVLNALFTMAAATLVFGSVSFIARYTAGATQIIGITATIVGLLCAIWSLRTTPIARAIAHFLEFETPNDKTMPKSTEYVSERNWNYLTTGASLNRSILSVAGKAQYLCVALSEDWYAENKIIFSPSKKLGMRSFPSRKNLQFEAIRRNTNNIDYLIKSIRTHEDALRSHGIHHVHIQPFEDYIKRPWVDEYYADFAFGHGRILFVILECSSEWSKVEGDWARDIVVHSCGESFADIVGIRGGVRDVKTLPSLPAITDTDQAIGVF